MPYVTRKDGENDITIHYEVVGHGDPVIFHHGNGNCVKDWYTLGYVDVLSPYIKMIMMDCRGYGKSSKPHDPAAYSLQSRAADTVAVLDDLGIDKVHCLGASFSASFCFQLAKYYPERFKSYIFATPFFTLFDENVRAPLQMSIEAFVLHLEELIQARIDNEAIRQTFLENDAKALWAANSAEWFDYSDYIKYIKSPSLIYVGSNEPSVPEVEELAAQLPQCTLEVIPGADHKDAYWRADLVAPVIKKFIQSLGE